MHQGQTKRAKRWEKTPQILEELKGSKSISNITSARKKTLIPKIRDEKDEIITSRKGIANVFGKFYSKLFSNEQQDEDECTDGEVKTTYHTKLKANKETNQETDEKEAENEEAKEESESIPEFTEREVQAAIDSLKKRNIWRQ